LTTADFLDALRAHLHLPSDYALMPVLGVTKSQISRYRQGHDPFSEEMAVKVAELLQVNPAYVLACSAANGARTEAGRRAWGDLAKKLSGVSVALLLFSLSAVPSDARASAADSVKHCVLCKIAHQTRFADEPKTAKQLRQPLRPAQATRDALGRMQNAGSEVPAFCGPERG
jgi:hypothetical protein